MVNLNRNAWYLALVVSGSLAGCFNEEGYFPDSPCPPHSTGRADGCSCDDGYVFDGTACVSEDTPTDTGTDTYDAALDLGIPCARREDCPAGEACLAGTCALNELGFCADIDECPVGEVCDETHVCVTPCDPVCGAAEACVDGVCVPDDVVVGYCDACAVDGDCGGVGRCATLSGGEPFCTSACGGTTTCPSGYTCQPVGEDDARLCVPMGGAPCTGCLADGCEAESYCDAFSGECMAFGGSCDACLASEQCGPDAECLTYGDRLYCLRRCETGCDEGYVCTTISDREVCAPEDGTCTLTCDLTAADCVGPVGIFDEAQCRCVGCLGDVDCDDGQLCSDAGTCLNGTGTCTSTAECGDGYCQVGVCIECLGNSDCEGLPCIAGACVACDCPAGQRCSPIDGACEPIPMTGDCSSDAECVMAAQALGHTGEGVMCDPYVGCFVAGRCGGPNALGEPLTDGVFDAPCPLGLVCSENLMTPGEGVCTGCDITNSASCRAGESCTDVLGTTYCDAGFAP